MDREEFIATYPSGAVGTDVLTLQACYQRHHLETLYAVLPHGGTKPRRCLPVSFEVPCENKAFCAATHFLPFI